MDKVKYWTEPLLQGLAYWLGYSRAYYSGHLLKEGAIVAEAVKLIHSSLKKNEEVRCELMFKDFINRKATSDFKKQRADIVIKEKDNKKEKGKVSDIIEVKRGVAVKSEMKKDINRMVKVHKYLNDVRTFLLLVSERKLPNDYVTENGYAKNKEFPCVGGYFRIRRVCKAASSFKKVSSANYSCLIEVFTNDGDDE